MEDGEIVGLLRQRKQEGLQALMEKYGRLACSIAYSVLGEKSGGDAAECVNDAFESVWENAERYDEGKASLKGWVTLITRRKAIDLARKRHGGEVSFEDFPADILSAPDDAESEFERREQSRELAGFVRGLPKIDRDIFLRRFFMLESIKNITDDLRLSRAAVDNRLSRMRRALEEALERSGLNG